MRLVSLAPSNTEILCALGLEPEIVGVTVYCDFPKSVVSKPKVGSWVRVKIDAIKALEPDLVLTSTIVQEVLAKELQDAGLTVLHLNPTTLDGVYTSVVEIGRATGYQNEAVSLVDSMQQSTQKHSTSKHRKKPRVYIEEWHRPPFVSGNWTPELVELAGGRYDLIRAGQLSREVTTAEIQNYDPEIIFLSICGFGDKLSADIIRNRDGWENISAVKSDNMYVLDDTIINRPGPRIVEAVDVLRRYIELV